MGCFSRKRVVVFARVAVLWPPGGRRLLHLFVLDFGEGWKGYEVSEVRGWKWRTVKMCGTVVRDLLVAAVRCGAALTVGSEICSAVTGSKESQQANRADTEMT